VRKEEDSKCDLHGVGGRALVGPAIAFLRRNLSATNAGEGTFHRMVTGYSEDGKEITEQHPSKLKPVHADGLFILSTSCW
jgi:hypothetical protein